MSVAGADNDDANSNIIFPLKDTKLFVPVVILSAKKKKKKTPEYRYFLLVYSNVDDNTKRLKLEIIFYQKVLLRIITSLMEKTFYDQPIGSDMKQSARKYGCYQLDKVKIVLLDVY